MIDGWCISCEIAIRWISLDLTYGKSALAQVMVWCRQTASHYLSQCWPRSVSPYGVNRPQWVKSVGYLTSPYVLEKRPRFSLTGVMDFEKRIINQLFNRPKFNAWLMGCHEFIGCQPDEPLASLVTTNRNINIYCFLVVIMLLMYSALHCLSVLCWE